MKLLHGSVLALCLLLGGCFGGATGGSEFGNPLTTVSGQLTVANQDNFSFQTTGESCGADTAILQDEAGTPFAVPLRADCSFVIHAPPEQTYTMVFEKDSVQIAQLVTNDGAAPAFTFFLDADLDLGTIRLENGLAFPSNPPAPDPEPSEPPIIPG